MFSRQIGVVEVREDLEVDDAQPFAPDGPGPGGEVVRDRWRHDQASGAESHVHEVERREELRQPGLAHPAVEVDRVAAVHEQHVGLLDLGEPDGSRDAGQRRELEDADGLPAELGHRGLGLLAGDEAPRELRAAAGADSSPWS